MNAAPAHWLGLRQLLALTVVFLVAGCATSRVDWNSRVGNYTYDQAVVELGPPDKQARLEDGTTVAEWLTYRGYYRSHGYGAYGPYCYPGAYYPPYYYESYSPDYFIRLIFGGDGRLRSWKKFTR